METKEKANVVAAAATGMTMNNGTMTCPASHGYGCTPADHTNDAAMADACAAERSALIVRAASPSIGCDQCTGIPIYRVLIAGMPAVQDNFDQLVDHQPRLFMHATYLRSLQLYRAGSITIWRLPTADQGGDLAAARIVAYAGPDPVTDARTWFSPDQPPSIELLATLTAAVAR